MNYTDLSGTIRDHILSIFRARQDESFVYHDLAHTESVVRAAVQIANHYQLNEEDFFIVHTAAWFHDIGYFEDYYNHEEKGAELASTYLSHLGVDETIVSRVAACILATKMPQRAQTKLEMIVCDADLFHFGTDDFPDNNKMMRKEVELKKGIHISKDDWRKNTISLLRQHHYFTDYCQLLLNDKKQENLDRLTKKATAREEKTKNAELNAVPEDTFQAQAAETEPVSAPVVTPQLTETIQPAVEPITQKKRKEEKDKNARPDRGIETMFRITSNNNQRLSDMADNKAQIMITVNSIILSAVISLLLRKLEEYQYLAWPTYLILTVSVTTIIFSILATRPSLPTGLFSQQDIEEKKVNLLFFGNFYKMNLSDYAAGMQQVMADREFLYGTLIKDVYSQGVVLGRKYKLLRISYNIFMFGLIASVLAFVAASILGK